MKVFIKNSWTPKHPPQGPKEDPSLRNFHRAESGGLGSGLLPLAQASPFSETCFPIERKASGSSVLLAPDILVSATSLALRLARHWASGEACGRAQGCPVASRLACRGGAHVVGEGLPLTLLLHPLTHHTVCSLLGGPGISFSVDDRTGVWAALVLSSLGARLGPASGGSALPRRGASWLLLGLAEKSPQPGTFPWPAWPDP